MIKLLSILSLCAATAANAAVLATWDNNTTSPDSADTLDSFFTSASLSFGSGLNKTEAGSNGFITGGDPVNSAYSLTDAIANDYYYSIMLTPNDGDFYAIESVTADFISQNQDRTFYLFSSLTGFDDASDSLGNATISNSLSDGNESFYDVSSVSELQTVTGSLELRLYVEALGSPSVYQDSGLRLDSAGADTDMLQIAGATAVPEPSTYAALAGLAALGLAIWRRRR